MIKEREGRKGGRGVGGGVGVGGVGGWGGVGGRGLVIHVVEISYDYTDIKQLYKHPTFIQNIENGFREGSAA